jgi:hypothetical protein
MVAELCLKGIHIMRTIHVTLMTAILVLLTACQSIRYDLRPPQSEQGRACVVNCAGNREACRSNEIRHARNERDACERAAERKYHHCMGEADSPETRRDCQNKRPGCHQSESFNRCDDEHRECFAYCGGTVTRIVEDR